MTTADNPYQSPPSYPSGQSAPPSAGRVGQGSNGMAVAALVLGILALVTSFTVIGGILLGVIGLVLGFIGRGRSSRGESGGGGMALAGIITSGLGILLAIALVALGVSILHSSSGQKLQACLNRANGNQAAIHQCDVQFDKSVN